MASTMSVRMKLSDFIKTDEEDKIMEMINKTHKDLRAVIFLYLWYENDEIDPLDLKDFMVKWEDKLFFKTKIKSDSEILYNEFIFYDLVPAGTESNERYRFKFEYGDKSNIISGLNLLYDCIKFITSDKPTKKQKRNDYED